MKILLFLSLLTAGIAGKAQMKGDTTKPIFDQIVFLMQQNKELSDRLDRAEKRIDSLERRPYLFIDNKGVRPGLLLTNYAGEYQIFVAPIK